MTLSLVEQYDTPGDGELAALRESVAGDGPRLPLAAPAVDDAAAKEAARQAVADLVDRQALDAVLAKVRGDGLRLTGPGGFLSELVKAVLERGLQAELTEHLGYGRHEAAGKGSGNSRNGAAPKTVQTEVGPVEVRVPRDRAGTFTPRLLPKNARRLGGLSDVVISLYAGGMTVRDISHHLHRVYGTEVSADTVSTITDEVLEEVKAWQHRPLDEVYPIVYVDALMVKVRDGGTVRSKACYLVVGVGVDGVKHVLGIWVQQAEGAKFS
jgi:putative transposase